jgi:hypothetical protein
MSPEGGHSHEEQSNVQQSDRARRRKSESGRGSLDDAELSRLLTDWVGERFPDDHDGVRRTFIDVEFRQRLRSYRKSARSWRAAQILLWLVVAVFGLLVSILAGFKTGHGFTIVAGALVALLTTLTNALHPSQAADGYQDARLALRDQGWSLLLSTDGYANMKEDAVTAYDQFAGQIRRIVQAKRATTRFTLGASNAPG